MVLNKHRRRPRMNQDLLRKGGYHDMKKKEEEDLRDELIRKYGTDDLDELRRRAYEEYD